MLLLSYVYVERERERERVNEVHILPNMVFINNVNKHIS